MYRFYTIFAIALSTTFLFPIAVNRAYSHYAPSQFQFFQVEEVLPLPPLELTLTEVIDGLTEYSLTHSDSVGCMQWYAVTDFDSKQIDVCDRYDLTDRREAIIHEFVHVLYRRHGLNTGGAYEPAVKIMAHDIYDALYKVKFPPAPLPTTPVEVSPTTVNP